MRIKVFSSFSLSLSTYSIKKHKVHKSILGVYNEQEKQNKIRGQTKNSSNPQEGPHQSTQSIKDKELPRMYT